MNNNQQQSKINPKLSPRFQPNSPTQQQQAPYQQTTKASKAAPRGRVGMIETVEKSILRSFSSRIGGQLAKSLLGGLFGGKR
jgi:predicted lipid-binding transport protein (Tim44 family)